MARYNLIKFSFLFIILNTIFSLTGSMAQRPDMEFRSVDFGLTGPDYSPVVLDIMESPYSYNQINKAVQTILMRMRIGEQHGATNYINHCRRADEGCEQRIKALVRLIFMSTRESNLDPWILISIGFVRSNFNPFRRNSGGFGGIMGVSPGQQNRNQFFLNYRFRMGCMGKADACQSEIIAGSAHRLRRSIDFCGTRASNVIRHFITNRCNSSPRIARRILRLRRQILQESNLVKNIGWCSPLRPICDETSTNDDPLDGISLDLEIESL